jgi:hypothetical protein
MLMAVFAQATASDPARDHRRGWTCVSTVGQHFGGDFCCAVLLPVSINDEGFGVFPRKYSSSVIVNVMTDFQWMIMPHLQRQGQE